MCALRKVLLAGLVALAVFGALTPLSAAQVRTDPGSRIDWLIEDPTPPKPGGTQESTPSNPANVPGWIMQVVITWVGQTLSGHYAPVWW